MGIRIDQETAYHQLILEQVRNSREYLVVFKNSRVAKHVLTQWIEDHQLCHKHSSLQDSEGACFAYKNDQCKGACLEEESTQSYNDRLHQLQDKNNYPHDHFLMIGSGRKDGEYSFIYIDNQCFKGYGFYELNHQIKNKEKILNRMIAMEDNSDCRTLILSHIKKNKFRKLIPLDIADINTH
jgi:DNA polymerase-3 subunit epsilon